jgi:cobalt-zinc-cadmium efflux system protein
MSGHAHDHRSLGSATVAPRTLAAAGGLTSAFVIIEVAAGWYGHSLALLSDAGHNLADVAALGLSWYALVIGRKPSHHGMTYGYHRVAVVAALANAVSLAGIAVWIAWEAIDRLQNPEPANSVLMIGIAVAAIVINTVISLQLHEASKADMNVRSAYVHMVGDAVAALGVVIAGAIVAITGSGTADPIVSILIAALILWSSWGVLFESATVLLEGTPPGTDMPSVVGAIKGVAGVLDVHDLHVWMVGPGVVACSCHVVVAEQSIRQGQQVVRAVAENMESRFHITHTTVQVEVEGCDPNELYCVRTRGHRGAVPRRS